MKPSVYISLSLLGLLLFTYPLLALFNRSILIGGIPALYLYLFGIWFVLIVLLIVVQKNIQTK